MSDEELLEDQELPEAAQDEPEAPVEECLGKYREEVYTQHTTPGAVVEHLRKFFCFNGAESFVERYGVAMVNAVLNDLETTNNLTNAAGYLNWAVRQKARRRRRKDSSGVVE